MKVYERNFISEVKLIKQEVHLSDGMQNTWNVVRVWLTTSTLPHYIFLLRKK